MNFRGKNLKLLARNEGKLKSFGSCTDLRAWSHSAAQRDLYLRDWIRSDMPVCVLPACSITSLFSGDSESVSDCEFNNNLTHQPSFIHESFEKCEVLSSYFNSNTSKMETQRCHPSCKSKGILESICYSCNAMRDCLKQDGKYQRYFDEEEFETCHWPCERCLEALKTIKLFWKLVAEKIFKVNFSSCLGTTAQHSCCSDSVQKISQQWQKEMVRSAQCILKHKRNFDGDKNEDYELPNKTRSRETLKCCSSNRKIRRKAIAKPEMDNRTVCKTCTEKRKKHCHRKSQCGFAKANIMKEVACGACLLGNELVQAQVYKANLDKIQQHYNAQKAEIERLRMENSKLKTELLTVFVPADDRGPSIRTPAHLPVVQLDSVYPYETDHSDEKLHLSHPLTDSEMIITMKNCKSETFRYVSLLQVLHKTNDPVNELSLAEPCLQNEDPIVVLNKVKKTFGDIVTRELNIAKDKNRWQKKRFDVDATFERKRDEKPLLFCPASSKTTSTYLPAESTTGTSP